MKPLLGPESDFDQARFGIVSDLDVSSFERLNNILDCKDCFTVVRFAAEAKELNPVNGGIVLVFLL